METVATIFVIVLLFAGLWAGAQELIALLSGWTLLARAYRCSGAFRGAVWRTSTFKMIRMKWGGFEAGLGASFPFLPRDVPDEQFGARGGELTVGADPEGLYLAQPFVVFRPGHPPLFIPWGDIAVNRRSVRWIDELKQSFDNRFWPEEKAAPADGGAAVRNGPVYFVFRFRKAPGVLLQFRESDGQRAAAAAGSSWPGVLQLQATPAHSHE
jgi:hypothetical protein